MDKLALDFPWSEQEWNQQVSQAVQAYWTARAGQALKQADAGPKDSGARGEVTGGQHLDAFGDLFAELIRRAGFHKEHVKIRTGVELPGYYRPSKRWDIVVVRNGRLCAAIELKSQVGPSFGNNCNNRTEEAVGSSVDLWLAFREGHLGIQAPWLGYFFFLEEAPSSIKPIAIASPAFPADPIFQFSSYAKRYEILCRRMLLERNYTGAALILSRRDAPLKWRNASDDLTLLAFSRGLYGHLIGCL